MPTGSVVGADAVTSSPFAIQPLGAFVIDHEFFPTQLFVQLRTIPLVVLGGQRLQAQFDRRVLTPRSPAEFEAMTKVA